MRLDRITLNGFQSHPSTDWQPNGARLVTLVGSNGAGKSSLLDGVAYSLFDAARGRTDDLVQLGATDMAATVEFTLGGERYRVTRGRTTKAGGRSFLEFAIAEFVGEVVRIWRPLTRETIRETQAAIEELLRVDATTFETAVLLMQGKANAFAEATAAERKRILSTVLGLDVYQRAEALAREEAHDLDVPLDGARLQADRLEEQLNSRPLIESALESGQLAVAQAEADIASVETTRTLLEVRARDVAQQLADGAAAEAEVGRLLMALAALRDRHVATKLRARDADDAYDVATQVLLAESDVAAAEAKLVALQDGLLALDTRAAADRLLAETIPAKRAEVQRAQAAHEVEYARWQSSLEATRRAIDGLVAGVNALVPVACPHCGKSFELDQAGQREKLAAARAHLREIEAAEPAEPLRFARDRAAVARLEAKRTELAYDAAAHEAARARLGATQRLAGRREAMESHRAAQARALAAAAAAEADLATIDAEGKAGRLALEEARARAGGLVLLHDEQASIDEQLRFGQARQRDLARAHAEAVAATARAQAAIENLDRVAAERAALATRILADEQEHRRLRSLVAAFGVTGIPARIIEGVLPELATHANELLAQLRPGVVLELRAQRAKKDGKGVVEALDLVVRDPAGERPLQMFSGGERMSVSLALAVGLSRLVARRAGTALRTLVIDEPDGLDADARRAFGQALRVLAHQGALERVVLVTHHEDLADVGDATFRVSKNGHGSVVEQVA